MKPIKLSRPSKGTVAVRTTEKDGKTIKQETVREESVDVDLSPDAEYVAYVTYRAGTTYAQAGTYSSVTCHVEVTLPVALPQPVRGIKNQKIDGAAIRRGLKAATALADEHFTQESKRLVADVFR